MTSALVSVVIATHNRPEDLRQTLRSVRQQVHSELEVIVIDDASDMDIEPIVREEWPDALFWRNAVNKRQAASRSDGMVAARGRYILSLDDDAALTHPDDISRAVNRMDQESSLGIIAFFVHNDILVPVQRPSHLAERYVPSFLAGAAMIRKDVVDDVGGYRSLLGYEGEEEEYALRVLAAGWRILFFPQVVVHHRVSPVGRNSVQTWRMGFRNKLWILVLHYPWDRVALEGVWKIFSNTLEMVRRPALAEGLWALGSCVVGLPKVLKLRRPLTRHTLRQYDALRFRRIVAPGQLAFPGPLSAQEIIHWFFETWLHRRRERAFWQRGEGGVGRSEWASFGATSPPAPRARNETDA